VWILPKNERLVPHARANDDRSRFLLRYGGALVRRPVALEPVIGNHVVGLNLSNRAGAETSKPSPWSTVLPHTLPVATQEQIGIAAHNLRSVPILRLGECRIC
jgi:hypothetical protein